MPTNKNFTYKNEFYNSANTSNTIYPERDVPDHAAPPPTQNQYFYKNESNHNTINRSDGGFPPQGTPEPIPGTKQTYFYKKETNETTNNVYGSPRPQSPQLPPVDTLTSIHERNVTDNRNVYHPPGGIPVYPSNGSLPPTKQTYMYKKETSNTTNTMYEPPNGHDYLPHDRYIEPPKPNFPPAEPGTNKLYKYSSTSSHKTTRSYQPGEREPLISPFPTDGIQPNQVDSQPPKHLGQLLASFDDVRFILIVYV